MASNNFYKIIFNTILLVSLSIIFLASSCDPAEPEDPDNKTMHYLNNTTTEDLIIYILPSVSSLSDSIFYCPKGMNSIIKRGHFNSTTSCANPFDALYNWRNSDSNIYAYIYSKDSVLLKTWNRFYTDSTQKQFFRESDWTKRVYEKNEGKIYKYHEYTFTLNQEDLN